VPKIDGILQFALTLPTVKSVTIKTQSKDSTRQPDRLGGFLVPFATAPIRALPSNVIAEKCDPHGEDEIE
jgi:hypothetical protein